MHAHPACCAQECLMEELLIIRMARLQAPGCVCAEVDGRLEAVIADFGLSTLLPRVDLSTSLES